MATIIFNKKRLIGWINRNIREDQIVFMTQDKTGSVSVSTKKNEKKVTFSLAADAFEAKNDVRDLALEWTPSVCLVICNAKHVSEESKKMLAEYNSLEEAH